MSLMERVQKSHDVRQLKTLQASADRLEDLKQELYCRFSSDEIARLVVDSPLRARNEIKSVCTGIFEGNAWSNVLPHEREQLIERLIDTVFGLGPLEALLNDTEITEIMVNGAEAVFYEKEGKLYSHDRVFATDDQVRALIDRIIGPLGRRIDESSPMVNARLKEGHRVNAIIPPLALDGPTLTIRKFRERLYTLEEMEQLGSLSAPMRQFLRWSVLARKNIAVSGGTGSGKTTLLNALSCVIPKTERIVTIEDSAELKFMYHPHVVRLESRPRNAEGLGEVTIRDLVINALRMRPDRIIVGECRGAEAFDMLQAMNTGHDGSLTTLHANSSTDAITRLSAMVRYAADLPISVIEAQIASAIDLVVQTARATDGLRYIQEMMVLGQNAQGESEPLLLYQRSSRDGQEKWMMPQQCLDEFCAKGVADREEVASWFQFISSEA